MMKIYDSSVMFCDRHYIKNKTNRISNEKLNFKGGERLGDLSIGIEDGATVRKIRRIVEKRVNQDLHYNRGNRGGRRRFLGTHNVSNTLRNIYGDVDLGFHYCGAA